MHILPHMYVFFRCVVICDSEENGHDQNEDDLNQGKHIISPQNVDLNLNQVWNIT